MARRAALSFATKPPISTEAYGGNFLVNPTDPTSWVRFQAGSKEAYIHANALFGAAQGLTGAPPTQLTHSPTITGRTRKPMSAARKLHLSKLARQRNAATATATKQRGRPRKAPLAAGATA